MRNGEKGLLLAALFTAAAFLSGCGTPSVKVMPAEKKMVPFVYETETKIDALHAMEIIPRVSGQIVSDIPDIGTAVQAGQLLFQIDASPYEAQKADLMGRAAAAVPLHRQCLRWMTAWKPPFSGRASSPGRNITV